MKEGETYRIKDLSLAELSTIKTSINGLTLARAKTPFTIVNGRPTWSDGVTAKLNETQVERVNP